MSNNRDDFSGPIKDLLANRVGRKCSNPNCRKLTCGPNENPQKITNIGVAAHICAAAKGGPRYDAKMSPEERKAPDNGIWLCQNCAKLIDSDTNRYTEELLRTWKQLAEKNALTEVEANEKEKTIDDMYIVYDEIEYRRKYIRLREKAIQLLAYYGNVYLNIVDAPDDTHEEAKEQLRFLGVEFECLAKNQGPHAIPDVPDSNKLQSVSGMFIGLSNNMYIYKCGDKMRLIEDNAKREERIREILSI